MISMSLVLLNCLVHHIFSEFNRFVVFACEDLALCICTSWPYNLHSVVFLVDLHAEKTNCHMYIHTWIRVTMFYKITMFGGKLPP